MSMTPDIAALGLAIDARPVDAGAVALDRFTEAGGRAERQTGALTATQRDLGRATDQAVSPLRDMASAIQAVEVQERASIRSASQLETAHRSLAATVKAAGSEVKAANNTFQTFYDAAERDFSAQYIRQMGKVSDAHRKGAAGAKLQAHEMLNLSRQFADIAVTGAMGMSPFMIAVQQGPQVLDIFQIAASRGVRASSVISELGGTAARVLGKAGPFAIGAGVVLGLGAAFIAGSDDAAVFSNALTLTGDAAGVTATQLQEMADAIGDRTEVGFSRAKAAVLAVAQTGQFTGRAVETVGDVVARLSDLSGKSAEDFARDFAKMGDDVTAFALRYQRDYGLLSAAQIDHIRLLEQQGDTAQAQMALITAAHAELASRGTKDLGFLDQAWRDLEVSIGRVWERMKAVGNSNAMRLVELQKLGDAIDTRQARATSGGPWSAADQRDLDRLRARRDALMKVEEGERAVAAAQGDSRRIEREGAAAQEELGRKYATGIDSLQRYQNELKKYDSLLQKMSRAGLELPTVSEQAAQRAKIYKDAMPQAAAAAQKAATASESAARAAGRRAEQLDREARAAEATIRGNLDLATAYGQSTAAALRAEAARKGTAAAIRRQGDEEAFVTRQVRLDISEQLAAGAKISASVRERIALMEGLNLQVREGVLSGVEATEQLRDELELVPLYAAAKAAATAKDIELEQALLDLIARRRKEQADLNRVQHESVLIAERRRQADDLELMQRELALVGATNRERAVELAMLQRRQELAARGDLEKPGAQADIEAVGNLARQAFDAQYAQDAYNRSLSYTLDLLNQVDDHTRDAASGMASAFGEAGRAVGDLATAMTGYAATQEAIRVETEARTREARAIVMDEKASLEARALATADIAHAETLAARESAKARVQAYGDMASAAKGFFEEGSAGYAAMEAAERAYRLFEFAMAAKSMILKATESAVTVSGAATETAAVMASETAKTAATAAGTAVRTPLKVAEGAASMFSSLGPLGFPAVAAMVAVMAGLGFSGGGGAVPGVNDAEDRQKRQGAGSVLGDANAKSNSIARSLEIVASNTNRDLEFSNDMLRALRSIDTGIDAVASGLARSLGLGGGLSTDGLGLGATTRSGTAMATLLGGAAGFVLSKIMPSWFGSTTTRTLQDQGLAFGSQSMADILAGGVDGQTYQQVLENTKKKAFGITYSDKTRVQTTTQELDEDFARRVGDLLGSLRSGVLAAADVLGVQGAAALVDAVQLNLGTISFKDMTSQEISDALNAVFSKAGDDLAATAVPSLLELQKVGEGAFETLARVARNYQVLDTSLTSIGMTFGAVGVASLSARERLIDLAGGIDEFVDRTNYFADNFLSDLERMAPIQRAVNAELERLGLAGLATKDAFKNTVLGLDLTTAAGQEMYAALMALAPAFSKVIDFQTEGSKAVQTAHDALSEAYDREAGALQNTRDKLRDYAKAFADFNASLTPNFDDGAAGSLERTRREFLALQASAATGDTDAMDALVEVAQAFKAASEAGASSTLEHQLNIATIRNGMRAAEVAASAQADVASQQLDALNASVAGILQVNQSVLSVRDALAAYQGAVAAQQAAATAPPPPAAVPTPVANDNTETAARGPNWASYMANNGDVAAEYARNMATEKGRAYLASLGANTPEAFGERHWKVHGKDEGRTPFATGGTFTVGGSGGIDSQNFGPMDLTPGEIVDIRRPSDVTRQNDQLARLLGAVLHQIEALRMANTTENQGIALATAQIARDIRQIVDEGVIAHGDTPDAPVRVKSVA